MTPIEAVSERNRKLTTEFQTEEARELVADLHRQATDPVTAENFPDAAAAYTNAESVVRDALPRIEAHIRGDHAVCDEAWHTAVTDWLALPETARAMAAELRRIAVDDLVDVDLTARHILERLAVRPSENSD